MSHQGQKSEIQFFWLNPTASFRPVRTEFKRTDLYIVLKKNELKLKYERFCVLPVCISVTSISCKHVALSGELNSAEPYYKSTFLACEAFREHFALLVFSIYPVWLACVCPGLQWLVGLAGSSGLGCVSVLWSAVRDDGADLCTHEGTAGETERIYQALHKQVNLTHIM